MAHSNFRPISHDQRVVISIFVMKETAMWSVPRVTLLLVKGVTVKATCVIAHFAFVSAAMGPSEKRRRRFSTSHTCHRSSNNCAVEACDSRQRVSAIIRLSMAPNQPVFGLSSARVIRCETTYAAHREEYRWLALAGRCKLSHGSFLNNAKSWQSCSLQRVTDG